MSDTAHMWPEKVTESLLKGVFHIQNSKIVHFLMLFLEVG